MFSMGEWRKNGYFHLLLSAVHGSFTKGANTFECGRRDAFIALQFKKI